MEQQPGVFEVCKNCGNEFTGKFCNNCGEKVFRPSDKTIKHLFQDFFHFIFHFEGSFLTTIKTIFTAPGKLSIDYCEGKRKRYFKPVSLFLLLVIIYLLFPYFEGLNQAMRFYTTNDFYGDFAIKRISQAMVSTGLDEMQLSALFADKGAKISKFLLVLLIPLTAVVLWLMSFGRKKYFYDQIIFAAEINSVYILIVFLLLPLFFIITHVIYEIVSGNNFTLNDSTITYIVLPLLFTWLCIAVRRFYKWPVWKAVLFALAFLFLHNFFVMLLYKFILFNLIIWYIS